MFNLKTISAALIASCALAAAPASAQSFEGIRNSGLRYPHLAAKAFCLAVQHGMTFKEAVGVGVREGWSHLAVAEVVHQYNIKKMPTYILARCPEDALRSLRESGRGEFGDIEASNYHSIPHTGASIAEKFAPIY